MSFKVTPPAPIPSPAELGQRLLAETTKASGDFDQLRAAEYINAGAALEEKDEQDNTPLINAAFNGHKDIAHTLIERKANINAQDFLHNTPLMLAISGAYDSIAFELINANANLDLKNEFKETAIILAAAFGRDDVLRELINKGLPLDEKDENGKTALDRARDKGHNGAVKIIEDELYLRDTPNRLERERIAEARQHDIETISTAFHKGTQTRVVAPKTATFASLKPPTAKQ